MSDISSSTQQTMSDVHEQVKVTAVNLISRSNVRTQGYLRKRPIKFKRQFFVKAAYHDSSSDEESKENPPLRSYKKSSPIAKSDVPNGQSAKAKNSEDGLDTDVELYSDESDQEQPNVNMEVLARPVKKNKRTSKRLDYFQKHGQAMANLIFEKGWLQYGHGNEIWKHIAENKLLEPKLGKRTWQSLRCHWTKIVIPNLEGKLRTKYYAITLNDQEKVERWAKDRKRPRTAKSEAPPFLKKKN